jgi:hypothetical protein
MRKSESHTSSRLRAESSKVKAQSITAENDTGLSVINGPAEPNDINLSNAIYEVTAKRISSGRSKFVR